MQCDKFFKHTFVINRSCDTSRMKVTHDILNTHNINYTRFEAITPQITLNNHTTKEMEGCGMSHKSIWTTIVEQKIKHAVIFEDDISFNTNFKTSLNQALTVLPKDWDLLTLGNFGIKSSNDKFNSPFNYILYTIVSLLNIENKNARIVNQHLIIPYFFTGAYGYSVSYKGATKLLKLIQNINFHIDVLIASRSSHLNIYSLANDICFQRTEFSTINVNSKKNNMLKLHFNLFQQLKDSKNVSYDYYMNVPVYRIGKILVNGWFILFLSVFSMNYHTRKFLTLILLTFTQINYL